LVGVMVFSTCRMYALRHAYVRTSKRNTGIGGKLAGPPANPHRTPRTDRTWAAATWAVAFYEKHGFVRSHPRKGPTAPQVLADPRATNKTSWYCGRAVQKMSAGDTLTDPAA
jgi:hypothetical protein